MEAKVYSTAGKETGKVALPDAVFGTKWNADLVHEVVTSMQANARKGTADTKDRSEVQGGGKKPWKQKGTGRARHGSRRSPIWAGGGVAHGPIAEKDYSKKINKNVRAKALASVLSKKYADGEVLFVDTFNFSAPKTLDAKAALVSLSGVAGAEDLKTKKKNNALIVLPARSENAELSFRNFGNIRTLQAKDISPVELLTYKYVIVAEPADAIKVLETRVATKTARKAVSK
ncbi:50S ribosomal protein L4 [Candidatus Parcubacteria bacterium]|uniref:Large ribosomal subunit protein uL4 n=1 Tax=Candidatus Kaiserbacteria bacterium CG10_big_fil_rev_8_21_14_0_10_47_16 TaxID=1974608 RepID=A0A2H0UDV9_9BACT|nr:50S ribosomal protein L4 [Candidatus Parcubacteria bacterium]PIR84540.1 MAG: 50S ribosomal protein L4 [Candidatus Kaiserbacteria bacterium CG10_big_fil_rev_8_21_14_0_10_47_16]